MDPRVKKILIANRGEIACRILRTCHTMGIATVTLHTPTEKGLPHALEGHQSYCLGEGNLQETYLNGNKIIEIARKAGAEGIHPAMAFYRKMVTLPKVSRTAD